MEQIFQNVIINRQEINSIEFEKESIEIPLYPGGEETFEILITNHGSPTHIHLSVSEELKGQITFLRDNPYVLQKEYVSAVARIPQEGRVGTDLHYCRVWLEKERFSGPARKGRGKAAGALKG